MSASRCRSARRSTASRRRRNRRSPGYMPAPRPEHIDDKDDRRMAANKTLLALPGDGIGPEVFKQVTRVIDWFDKRRAVRFDIKTGLVGGAALEKLGVPLPDSVLADAMG